MFKISRAVTGRNPGAVRSLCGNDCHAGLDEGLQCLASGQHRNGAAGTGKSTCQPESDCPGANNSDFHEVSSFCSDLDARR